MGPLPCLRRKNAIAAAAKNRAAGLPLVLPKMQAGAHHQCAEFSNRTHPSARRKDAVLTAAAVVGTASFRGEKHEKIIDTKAGTAGHHQLPFVHGSRDICAAGVPLLQPQEKI